MLVVYLVGTVVGVGVVAWIARNWSGALKALRAANEFQAASVETLTAIREAGPERAPTDRRVFLALQRWEGSRSVVRGLTVDQQRIAVETLRDRGFPIADVGEAISEFIGEADFKYRGLDEDLAAMVAGR